MDQPTDNAEALELIGIHRARLRELRKQEALFGATVDPSVPIQIREIEQKIANLQLKVSQAVSALGLPASLMSTEGATGAAHPVAQPPPPDLGAVASDLVPTHLGQAAAALVLQGPALVLDPPAIQLWVGRRTETVAELLANASGTTWFALNGIASRGKTLLSRLLADALGGAIKWVSFAGLSDGSASLMLERVCFEFTKTLPPPHRDQWYRAACEGIGAGSVLVFDDLPNLAASAQLASRLPALVRACATTGVKVISSSLFTLPQGLLQDLGTQVIDRTAPPFTNRDAEEVLGAFGAPTEIVRSTARLINAVSRQHPTLLVAACRYLQSLNWVLAGDGIQGLFLGTYTNDIAAEVHQKLLRTVPDPDTRNLLYRLSLVAGPFSWDDVDVLAGYPPPIEGARERLRDVINSWVEQQPDGRCVVSGLLAQFGRDNLPGPVKQGCHIAIAESIVSRGTINQHSAFVAITHYHMGGEFGKAGTILTMILQKALEHAEWIRDDALLLLWTDMPLPVEMDLDARLIIRGLHIGLFHKLDKPLDFLFADFNSLISGVTAAHRFGVAGAVSFIIMAIGRSYSIQAGTWLRRFLQLPVPAPKSRIGWRPRRNDKERPALELSDEFPLHAMIWMLIGELKTPAHVRDWLETVKALPTYVRNRAMAVDESHVSSIVVAESLTGAEQEKPPTERNWPSIVAALTEFAEQTRAVRCEILWACFVRAKITVQAETCRDIDGAVMTATQASQIASVDPVVRFFINGAIGRQLLLAKRYSGARFWLRRAIEQNAESVFAYERVNILLSASHAFGLEDPKLGASYAAAATDIAESDDSVPAIERARAWCERGVAEYMANGAKSAFVSWERAGEILFAISVTGSTPSWKEMMVLYGHVSGYLARLAGSGDAPKETRDGQPYAPPERGVFMTANAKRVEYFNEHIVGGLWRIIGYYAEAVEDAENAKKWRLRANDAARRTDYVGLVAEADREDIPRVLRENGFRAALELGRKAGQAMVLFNHETNAGRLGVIPAKYISAAFAKLSEAEVRTAEGFGILNGLIPCVLVVATCAVQRDGQDAAKLQAQQLIDACREIGKESAAPDQWALMADLLERSFIMDNTASQVAEWIKTIPQPQAEGFELMMRLVASTNAGPSEAVASMLAVMPYVCGCFPPQTAIHKELLVPFITSYWAYKFEYQRFDINSPMILESELPKAFATPEEERVVAVFKALLLAFRFKGSMPDATKRWLYGR